MHLLRANALILTLASAVSSRPTLRVCVGEFAGFSVVKAEYRAQVCARAAAALGRTCADATCSAGCDTNGQVLTNTTVQEFELEGFDSDLRSLMFTGKINGQVWPRDNEDPNLMETYDYQLFLLPNYRQTLYFTRNGLCDIGWGPFTIRASREACAQCPGHMHMTLSEVLDSDGTDCCLDFAQSYLSTGLTVAYSASHSSFGAVYGSPALVNSVAYLLLTMIFTAHLIWAFERKHNREEFSPAYVDGKRHPVTAFAAPAFRHPLPPSCDSTHVTYRGRPHAVASLNFPRYFGEHAHRTDSPVDFVGILHALWWTVVTITTVGYGDKTPKSGPGRAVASLFMFVGVTMIYPRFTGIIASELVTAAQNAVPKLDFANFENKRICTTESYAPFLKTKQVALSVQISATACMLELAKGTVDGVLYDKPILDYMLTTYAFAGSNLVSTPALTSIELSPVFGDDNNNATVVKYPRLHDDYATELLRLNLNEGALSRLQADWFDEPTFNVDDTLVNDEHYNEWSMLALGLLLISLSVLAIYEYLRKHEAVVETHRGSISRRDFQEKRHRHWLKSHPSIYSVAADVQALADKAENMELQQQRLETILREQQDALARCRLTADAEPSAQDCPENHAGEVLSFALCCHPGAPG